MCAAPARRSCRSGHDLHQASARGVQRGLIRCSVRSGPAHVNRRRYPDDEATSSSIRFRADSIADITAGSGGSRGSERQGAARDRQHGSGPQGLSDSVSLYLRPARGTLRPACYIRPSHDTLFHRPRRRCELIWRGATGAAPGLRKVRAADSRRPCRHRGFSFACRVPAQRPHARVVRGVRKSHQLCRSARRSGAPWPTI